MLLGLATALLAAAVVVGGIGMLAGFDELRRTPARLPYGVIGFNTLVALVVAVVGFASALIALVAGDAPPAL
ncbi:MAG TPA: hypothetical protein VK874_15405, partial [Gaiellaceae bacterium]|nr:hypothetical protein [Gaiellaceae bacterium]